MEPLSIIPRGQQSTDVAELENGCSWTRLGYGDAGVTKYLNATQAQLRRLSKLKPSALRASFGSQSAESFDFLQSEQTLRGSLGDKILFLHSNVNHLASLLVEIATHRANGQPELSKGCEDELRNMWKKTLAMFKKQMGNFSDTLRKHKTDTLAAGNEVEAAQRNKLMFGSIGMLMGFLAFATGAPLFRDLFSKRCDEGGKQVAKPAGVVNALVGEFLTWLRQWFVLGEESVPRAAIYLYPIVPFFSAILCGGFSWICLLARATERRHRQLREHADNNTEFVRENEEMWKGMNQLVDALQDKVLYFEKLDSKRTGRVKETLNDIAGLAWNMLMSTNIYMVWLERHGIFPPNVSVPILVGPSQYQAISRELDAGRAGWFRFGALTL